MSDVNYSVQAELSIKGAKAAADGIKGAYAWTERLKGSLRGAGQASDGLTRNLLAVAGVYGVFSRVTAGIKSLGGAVLHFVQDLEQSSIQIATLQNRIEGIPFPEAERNARHFIDRLKELSLQTPATGYELIRTFQSISGPIAAVTGRMEDALQTSQELANAASALGIDFEQASRDFRMMMEGRAGAQVMLFSRLKSVGEITETAEAFNAMAKANPAEAYERLKTILQGYNVAAERQGRSLAGLTSSFKSLFLQITGAGMEPIVESFKRFLMEINSRLFGNLDKLRGGFERVGERIAHVLDGVFERLVRAFDYVLEHWDQIVARMERAVDRVVAIARALPKIAQAFAAFSAARMAGGVGLGIAGAAVGGIGAAGGVLGGLAATIKAIGDAGPRATGPLGMLMQLFSPIGLIGAVFKAAAFVAIIALLGTFMAVGAAIARELTDNWAHWAQVWKQQIQPLIDQLKGEFVRLWGELRYVMRDIGRGALRILIGGFKMLLEGAVSLVRNIRTAHVMWVLFTDGLMATLNQLFAWLKNATNGLVDIAPMARRDPREIQALIMARMSGHDPEAFLNPQAYAAAQRAAAAGDASEDVATSGGGADRETPNQTFDFRGSKISIQQEFAQGDPDRVAVTLRRDLAGQAERRLASGFVPALGR